MNLAAARTRLTAEFPLVNDHPDVAGVLRDPALLKLTAQALAYPFQSVGVELVLAPSARGPIFGSMVAAELDAGLIVARREGDNHPGADMPIRSRPSWRGERVTFLGRSFDMQPGQRVLIVDDWITTGNSIRSMQAMLRLVGCAEVGVAVLVNKADPATLEEIDPHWLVLFDHIMNR